MSLRYRLCSRIVGHWWRPLKRFENMHRLLNEKAPGRSWHHCVLCRADQWEDARG